MAKRVVKGKAFNIAPGMVLFKGKNPNKTDDIDIGPNNPKQGISVNNNEIGRGFIASKDGKSVIPISNTIQILSNQPMLGGVSPTQLLYGGVPFDKVFAMQEQYKDIHGINDDGSRQYAKYGIRKRFQGGGESKNEESKKRTAIAYGDKTSTRLRYLNLDKKLVAYINHVAKQYNIPPALLASRLSSEGVVDKHIKYLDNNKDKKETSLLEHIYDSGYGDYGLDDTFSLYKKGKLNLRRKIPFQKNININEHNRIVHSVRVRDPYDGIELMAANLEYLGKEIKKKFPNLKDKNLDTAIAKAYNIGLYGAMNDIAKNGVGSKYKINDGYYNINYNNDIYLQNKDKVYNINKFTIDEQNSEIDDWTDTYSSNVDYARKYDNAQIYPTEDFQKEWARKHAIKTLTEGDYEYAYPIGTTDYTYNNPFANVNFSFKLGGQTNINSLGERPNAKYGKEMKNKRKKSLLTEFVEAFKYLPSKNDLNSAFDTTKNLIEGDKFKGGDFGGAGASVGFYGKDGNNPYDYVRNTPILSDRSFSEAYANARKQGLSSFMFNGKKYNTDYDPNAKLGNRVVEQTPVLNLREVLDENEKVITDSTRVEPWLGQIPGMYKRDKYKFGGERKKAKYGKEIENNKRQRNYLGSGNLRTLADINAAKEKLGNYYSTFYNPDGTVKKAMPTFGQLQGTTFSPDEQKMYKKIWGEDFYNKNVNGSGQFVGAFGDKLSAPTINLAGTDQYGNTIDANGQITKLAAPKTKLAAPKTKLAPTNPVKNPTKSGGLSTTAMSAIGAGINTLGSLIGSGIQQYAINNLKAPQRQYTLFSPVKLKTKININPQIARMREMQAQIADAARRTSGSSRTAYQKILAGHNRLLDSTRDLYGRKENIETELINRDRLNQQQVAQANATNVMNAINQNNELSVNNENRQRIATSNNWTGALNTTAGAWAGPNGFVDRANALRVKTGELYTQAIANPTSARLLYGNINFATDADKRKAFNTIYDFLNNSRLG